MLLVAEEIIRVVTGLSNGHYGSTDTVQYYDLHCQSLSHSTYKLKVVITPEIQI